MTADRIAALEATITTAMAELQLLKAGGKAVPPPISREDEGTRVVPILDERRDMPSLKELERLYAKVRPLAPWPQALSDRYDEHRPFRGFCSCFRWVQNVGRSDRPNNKFVLAHWRDTCVAWLRARNAMGGDVEANALILAVYAAGDVCYTPANPVLGHVWEIGVVEYGGRKASDSWRNVMTSGQILPPSAPAQRFAPPSPARVYVGG